MKSTFRILFYVKRDKQKSDGTLPIMCRITIDGQPSRFNTKVSVSPNIWNAKASIAIGRSNEAVEVNALLNEITTSSVWAEKPSFRGNMLRYKKSQSIHNESVGV